MSDNSTPQNVVDLSSPLAIYNATEAALQKLKEDYSNLTIAGINDKDGYKAVSEGLRIVVGLRNKVDKRRQELKRHIDAGSKAILTQLEPVEKHLRGQKDTIDNEVARLEQEAKEAEFRKFNERTSRLFTLGFNFNGAIYTLGSMALTADQIRSASDADFEALITQGREIAIEILREKEAEAARFAEIERREKELAEREAKLAAAAATVEVPKVEVKEPTVQATPEPPKVSFTKPAAEPPRAETITQQTGIPKYEQDELGNFITTEAETPTPEPSMPNSYRWGFNACRDKVIEILQSPDKFTRAELIQKINNLKP